MKETEHRNVHTLDSEEVYAIFMQAPAMMCVFEGPNHVFKFVNPPYQALVGNRPLLGKPIAEAMPELQGQPIFSLLDNVYRTGQAFHAHEMLVQLFHDNSAENLGENYYNFVYQAIKNPQGEITGILVFAYEVTAQVRAKQEAQELNTALETTNRQLESSNQEQFELNRSLNETNHELAANQEALYQLNAELDARVQERTKQLEQSLLATQQNAKELATQQGLLSQILGQVPAYIATLHGPDHRFTFFNSHYSDLTSGRAKIGMPAVEALPEVEEQGFIQLLDNVYRSGEPYIGVGAPVLLYDAKTGKQEQRYVDFIYQPLNDRAGKPEGILAFIIDVTDKIVAKNQLEEVNQQLTRTNVDLDNFIYSASHDLKNPILNIEGLITILQDDLTLAGPISPGLSQILSLMHDSVSRFKRTIEVLTNITKLQQASGYPTSEISVGQVLEDVSSDLDQAIKASGAQIAYERGSCLTLRSSEKNLRSIIYNLVSNAIKYRSPDRPSRIQVRCHQSEAYHVLSVQDNGLGIDPGKQQKVFEMFSRLHDHVEGSGIGLFMVKRIIENIGGKVEVESALGEGSTFKVYFPACEVPGN